MHEIRGISYSAQPCGSPARKIYALDHTRPLSLPEYVGNPTLLLASERTRRRKVAPTRLTSSRSHCDSIATSIRTPAPIYSLADKAGPLNVQSCQLRFACSDFQNQENSNQKRVQVFLRPFSSEGLCSGRIRRALVSL